MVYLGKYKAKGVNPNRKSGVEPHRRSSGTQYHSPAAPASYPISSRLDFVLPLDQDGKGQESEVESAQLSLTVIQFTRSHDIKILVMTCHKSPVAMGE